MKKTKTIRLASIIFILFWGFVALLTQFSYFLPNCYPHKFCSNKCEFWTLERGKGHNTFGSVLLEFQSYKDDINRPDLKLYRRTARKWWQVWNWYEFLFHPRWQVPYAERDEDT